MPVQETSGTGNGADSAALWACAMAMADAAAVETLPRFRALGLGIEDKGDRAAGEVFDPVTEADRAAEAAMRDVLARLRPDDGIYGEELGQSTGRTGLTWVIDPIDGTRAFMIGAPTWGTLIAAVGEDGPLLGMIDQPYTGERWLGGLGKAEILRGGSARALSASTTRALSGATLCTTFPEIGTPAEHAAFRRVADQVRLVRYGLDCYGYGLVATGTVDLVIEAGLAPYDVCGPIGVVSAAGGIVTDWQGRPAHGGGQVLAAANAALHAAALELLNAS